MLCIHACMLTLCPIFRFSVDHGKSWGDIAIPDAGDDGCTTSFRILLAPADTRADMCADVMMLASEDGNRSPHAGAYFQEFDFMSAIYTWSVVKLDFSAIRLCRLDIALEQKMVGVVL